MVNIREVKFITMLTPEDRYRHYNIRHSGEVISFVIQYETRFEGQWVPVVRYDTEHGFAHRDILDRRGNKKKTPIFTRNYNEALTYAEYDIKANWMSYKQAFYGGAGNG